jgi:surface antigen
VGDDARGRPALEPSAAALRERNRRAGVAGAEGFQLNDHPTADAIVVFGSAYGVFGHIATVRAVQDDRYEVVEQNFLDFDPQLEPHWATFDLRSVAWPDAAVVGFVVALPSR